MNWRRQANGSYTAGPYRVDKVLSSWYADGPSNAGPDIRLDSAHLRKDLAQDLCAVVAEARAANPDVTPVIGDAVEAQGQHGPVDFLRRGHITSIMPSGDGRQPLYCIKFSRGKRLCLFRHEFTVVVP